MAGKFQGVDFYDIDSSLSEEERMVRDTVRDWVEDKVLPVIADARGLTPQTMGELPEQCAALNRTNINTQLLTIEAAVTRKREHIYQAAMLDPHTGSELSLDEIVSLCDDLIEAHGEWLPEFR